MTLRILLVEDEVLIAETIRLYLEERLHRVTAICVSYEEAVAAFEQERPDMVLLDIRLYSANSGIDVARYLDQQSDPVPYIYITSQYDQPTIDKAMETKPCGYLVKPLQKESLWTTLEVARTTGRILRQRPTVFTVSDGSKIHQLERS